MKTRHWLFLVAIAALVAWTVTGCSLLGVSIDSRISMFFSDLNSNRANANENLDPSSPIHNSVGATADFWNIHFPQADGQLTDTITSSTPYNAAGVILDITSSLGGTLGTYEFVFVDRGTSPLDNYYISDILLLTNSTYVSIF